MAIVGSAREYALWLQRIGADFGVFLLQEQPWLENDGLPQRMQHWPCDVRKELNEVHENLKVQFPNPRDDNEKAKVIIHTSPELFIDDLKSQQNGRTQIQQRKVPDAIALIRKKEFIDAIGDQLCRLAKENLINTEVLEKQQLGGTHKSDAVNGAAIAKSTARFNRQASEHCQNTPSQQAASTVKGLQEKLKNLGTGPHIDYSEAKVLRDELVEQCPNSRELTACNLLIAEWQVSALTNSALRDMKQSIRDASQVLELLRDHYGNTDFPFQKDFDLSTDFVPITTLSEGNSIAVNWTGGVLHASTESVKRPALLPPCVKIVPGDTIDPSAQILDLSDVDNLDGKLQTGADLAGISVFSIDPKWQWDVRGRNSCQVLAVNRTAMHFCVKLQRWVEQEQQLLAAEEWVINHEASTHLIESDAEMEKYKRAFKEECEEQFKLHLKQYTLNEELTKQRIFREMTARPEYQRLESDNARDPMLRHTGLLARKEIRDESGELKEVWFQDATVEVSLAPKRAAQDAAAKVASNLPTDEYAAQYIRDHLFPPDIRSLCIAAPQAKTNRENQKPHEKSQCLSHSRP